MIIYLEYLVFFTFCYFSGRSFFIILSNFKFTDISLEKIFDIKISTFFPFYGLFFLGNIIVFLNFVTPITQNIKFAILLLLLLPNLKLINKIDLQQFNFFKTFVKFLSSIILLFSFSDIGISKDAYLYHIKNQLWILEEKIVFGIANLDPFLGYLPISEYIHSFIFSIDNYKYIHFFNLTIIISFTYILLEMYFSKSDFLINSAFLITIFGILDNFGFEGGRNGYFYFQELGKVDGSTGIIFLLSILLILFLLQKKSYVKEQEIIAVLLFSIFSIQLRPFGYILFIFLIYLFFSLGKSSWSYFMNLKYLLVFLIWHIKNLVTTSCIIYPVNITCIPNFEWHTKDLYVYLSKFIIAEYWDPQKGFSSLGSFDWILNPWINLNKSYLLNFLFTFIFIFLILSFNNYIKSKNKFLTLSAFILFLFWLLAFPQYRFTSSIFIPATFLFFNSELSQKNKIFNKLYKYKFLIFFLLIINTAFLVNKNSYLALFQSRQIAEAPVDTKSYFERVGGYGVSPTDVFCGANKDCYYWEYVVIEKKIGNYIMFKLQNENYYTILNNKNIKPSIKN